MKLTLDNPPEGFEARAEFRQVEVGEWFLNTFDGVAIQSKYEDPLIRHRIVLTKKIRRFLTFEDVELPEGFICQSVISFVVTNQGGSSRLLSLTPKIITK